MNGGLNLMRGDGRVDRVGALCSGVCAAHCGSSAFFPHIIAALGLTAWFGHTSEWALTTLAVSFASIACVVTWRRLGPHWIHTVFATGIIGLVAARAMEEMNVHGVSWALGIVSGVLLASGHVLSMLLTRARVLRFAGLRR